MKDKEGFNLKEVSEIVGVAQHIIRYWQAEFRQVKPARDELNQNIFSRKDLNVIIRIYYFLYEEKLSIADTKIKLAKEFD